MLVEVLKLEIKLFKTLPSTQNYLVEAIKNGSLKAPVSVLTLEQNAGIGSRNNSWVGEEGNFYASFAVSLDDLPKDLPLFSSSIYFSFIMKNVLSNIDKDIWLKWPNDLYKKDKKLGGTITKKVNNTLIFGIGINLKQNRNGYGVLDGDISPKELLDKYILALEKFPSWKQVFSNYEVEFESNREFSVHIEDEKKSLENALLCKDGSLIIEDKKVYSLR